MSSSVAHSSGEVASVRWRYLAGRVLKSVVGVSLLAAGTRAVFVAYILSYSSEAVITATKTAIRAPIKGTLSYPGREIGQLVKQGEELATIKDERIDDSELHELEEQLASTEAERDALVQHQEQLGQVRQQLASGASLYQSGRLDQLNALLGSAKAQADAESAKLEQAALRLARVESLAMAGVASNQDLEDARRDRAVSEQLVLQANAALIAATTTLQSSRRGTNLDATTDKPYSRQRLDEVDLRRTDLAALHRQLDARAKALATRLALEAVRIQRAREARLIAPFSGKIWETTAASGEYVGEGKSLFEEVDCSKTLVLAWVTERNFRRIELGTEATVQVSPTREYPARVVQLVGYLEQLPDVIVRGVPLAVTTQQANHQHAVILTMSEGQTSCELLGRNADVRFHVALF